MTDGIVRVKLELASNGSWRRWELPSGCLCPITQEPYEDPVMCSDGHTYSREAITGWFAYGRCTSPMTGLRLDSLVLVPNHAMRITVEQMVDERIRLEWANEKGARGRTLAAERAGSPDVLKP